MRAASRPDETRPAIAGQRRKVVGRGGIEPPTNGLKVRADPHKYSKRNATLPVFLFDYQDLRMNLSRAASNDYALDRHARGTIGARRWPRYAEARANQRVAL